MTSTLQWLESTGIGTLVRESLYGFPVVVGLHLLGLAVAIGSLVWFDLRLVGAVLTSVPVSRVYRQMMPWAASGFVVSFVTGALLFIGYASSAYVNPYFWLKMSALVVAGINAAYYHLVTEAGRGQWDLTAPPPAAVRVAGLVSLLAWTVVILSGRAMAYTMY